MESFFFVGMTFSPDQRWAFFFFECECVCSVGKLLWVQVEAEEEDFFAASDFIVDNSLPSPMAWYMLGASERRRQMIVSSLKVNEPSESINRTAYRVSAMKSA